MKHIQILSIALLLVSCNADKVDREAEGEKVMQLSREWAESAASGDVEKTLSYWADDAIVMMAGQGKLHGKQAIRQMVEESFRTPGFKITWQPQSVEVSESGDIAYLVEESQVTFTDSTGTPVTLRNNAVTIWKKQSDGSWKNVVDIATPE